MCSSSKSNISFIPRLRWSFPLPSRKSVTALITKPSGSEQPTHQRCLDKLRSYNRAGVKRAKYQQKDSQGDQERYHEGRKFIEPIAILLRVSVPNAGRTDVPNSDGCRA